MLTPSQKGHINIVAACYGAVLGILCGISVSLDAFTFRQGLLAAVAISFTFGIPYGRFIQSAIGGLAGYVGYLYVVHALFQR